MCEVTEIILFHSIDSSSFSDVVSICLIFFNITSDREKKTAERSFPNLKLMKIYFKENTSQHCL